MLLHRAKALPSLLHKIHLFPVVVFITACLLILTSSRILLLIWQHSRISSLDDVYYILFQGIRMDIVVVFILAIPAVLLPFLHSNNKAHQWVQRLIAYWFFIGFIFLTFMELITPQFIIEYDLRPNRLFVEYLNAPKEIFSMLITGYKVTLLTVLLAISATGFLAWKLFIHKVKFITAPMHILKSTSISILVFIVMLAGIRSTLQNRPVNPSTVSFSNDPLLNMLPLSSAYNMLYSVYRMQNENDITKLYGAMSEVKMLNIINQEQKQFHKTKTHLTQTKHKQPNIVILVQESLGATYVGSLGGLPLTPNIDQLKKDSWWFENAYATGTRSARGLEAITTGFLPTPSRAVLKLPKSQQHFFTLASALHDQGYHSSFIYGGESHFDNMRGFFLNNGFDRVVDENDYVDPEFRGSWGVSDEDLFKRADSFFSQSHDQPFLSVVFSSSNHSPWEYPDNKIQQYDAEKASRNNAVKYADYALGKFIEKAKQSNYWDDTIFVIVADHDSRVFGEELVPVSRFHIPMLIFGGAVKAKIDTRVVSQIDLAPTLLSLINLDVQTPMIGHDLTINNGYPGRAIMQYGANQAYLEGDNVVILQPNTKPVQFIYQDKILRPTILDENLADTALAHALWANWEYQNQLYTHTVKEGLTLSH